MRNTPIRKEHLQSPRYSDLVHQENLARIRKRIKELTDPRDLSNLSQIAQIRKDALNNFPYLKKNVLINNEGIVVKTDHWFMHFDFQHYEWNKSFNCHEHQFTKAQLEQLIQIFGPELWPYLSVLWLKTQSLQDSSVVDRNGYWSNTKEMPDGNKAWCLLLHSRGVKLDLIPCFHKYSAFKSKFK